MSENKPDEYNQLFGIPDVGSPYKEMQKLLETQRELGESIMKNKQKATITNALAYSAIFSLFMIAFAIYMEEWLVVAWGVVQLFLIVFSIAGINPSKRTSNE